MDRTQKITQLKEQGLSYGSIGKLFNVSRARVHQIYSGYHPHDNHLVNLRNFIFKRDNYTCQWGNYCKPKKLPEKKLLIHHIDFNDNNNSPSNLITVCENCHLGFHSKNHIDKNIEKKLVSGGSIEKTCLTCGKKFKIGFANSKNRKYCSRKCCRKYKTIKEKREAKIKQHREWQKNNPEKLKAVRKKYYEKNKEKIFKRNKIYQQKNRKELNQKAKERFKQKYHNDPIFRKNNLKYQKNLYNKRKIALRIKSE